jgi:hypothetical protein
VNDGPVTLILESRAPHPDALPAGGE